MQSLVGGRALVAKSPTACHAPRRRESPYRAGRADHPEARHAKEERAVETAKTVIELIGIGLFSHCAVLHVLRRVMRQNALHVYS